MKVRTSACAVLSMFFLAVVAAAPAEAQWSCGSIRKGHEGSQQPGRARYQMQAWTERDVSICPFIVQLQTEAWIHGYSADVQRGTWVATVNTSAGVPVNQWAYSTGKHWMIINFAAWTQFPNTTARAFILPPPPKQAELCHAIGGEWIDGTCRIANTPLIVDVGNNGYELTSARKGVFFDLDADGEQERVAWTSPNGDEAFLAMDRNGNGRIDDGTELFGDRSPMTAGQPTPYAADGFKALLALENPDHGPSRADGIIDRQDSAFSRLYLWHDANHDGISQPRELQPLTETDIVGFDTAAKEKKRVDEHGNRFGLKGKVYVRHRNGKIKAQDVWDIWLRRVS